MNSKILMNTWLLGSSLLLTSQIANAALTAVGANDPQNDFPVSYTDSTGTVLGPCLNPNDPNCIPLEGVDPAQPISFPGNFPGEFFYWFAEATMPLSDGGDCLTFLAIEGAFANEVPQAGDRLVFNRTRFRCNVAQPGTYRITWPFGSKDFVVAAVGPGREINDTDDHGVDTPENFVTALGGQNGPFLRWDPAVAPAAPAGYVGDPNVLHQVTGSPLLDASLQPQNYFKIERLDTRTGILVQLGLTNLFTIAGKTFEGGGGGDTIPPTVTAPVHNITGTSVTATSANVIISWTGNDNVGVSSYTLEQSVNGGAFTPVTLASPTATTFTAVHAFGSTHQYRVSASDAAGNVSTVTPGLKFNPTLFQQFNNIVYSTSWLTYTSPGAIGGTLRQTSTTGGRATTNFAGNSVAWIQSKMNTRGIGEVLLNGVSQGTRDLYSRTIVAKNIAFIATNLGPGTHSLRVRNTGLKNPASFGRRVDVDGFLVLRTVP